LSDNRKPSIDDIYRYLVDIRQRGNGDKILVILDGYDEISQSLKGRPELQRLLKNILRDPDYHVIITSRPIRIILEGSLMVPDNDDRWLTLENVGFTKENIRNYIRKFLDTSKQGPLIYFIESNRYLQSLAHIPLNLELICSVWSDNKTTADTKATEWENTITQLYTKMTNKFFEFTANKEKEGSKYDEVKKKVLIELLGEVALEGLINKCSIIPAKEAQAIIEKTEEVSGVEGLFKEILSLGIIKTIYVNQDEKDNQIYFIHHTFQEYFAATYLAQGFENYYIEDEKYKKAMKMLKDQLRDQKYKYNPYYEVMWVYTIGILYANCNEKEDYLPLFKFWDIFENEPRELLGLTHDNLKLKLLNECPPLKDPPAALEALRTAVIKTTKVLPNLFKIIESDVASVAKKLHAIEEVVNLGMKTEGVESKLKAAMNNDEEEGVRLYAAEALLRLGFYVDVSLNYNKGHKRLIYTIFATSKPHLKEYTLAALYRVHVSRNLSTSNSNTALLSLFAIFDECESIREKLQIAECLIRISENYSSKEVKESHRKEIVELMANSLKHENQSIRQFAQKVLSRNRDNPHIKIALEVVSKTSDSKLQESIKEAMSMESIFPPIDFLRLAMAKPPSNKLNGGDVFAASVIGGGTIGGVAFFAGSIQEIRKAAPSSHSKLVETFANTVTTGIMTGLGVVSGSFSFGFIALGGAITYQAYQAYFSSISPAELDSIVLSKAENKDGEKAKLKAICEKVNNDLKAVKAWSKEGVLNLKLAIQLYSFASQAVWLEPMKNITFIYKDPKAFFTVCEEVVKQAKPKQQVIRISGQRLTKRTIQTKAVLGAISKAYKEAKLPTKLLNHYLNGTSLDVSTEKEEIAMARRIRSNRPMGLTMLHKAAKEGTIEEVRKLVEAKEIDINDFNNQDWKTPLILAIENKRWEIVEYLVENGADVNIGGAVNFAYANRETLKQVDMLIIKGLKNPSSLAKVLSFAVDDYISQVTVEGKKAVLDKLVEFVSGEDRSWMETSSYITDLYHLYLGNISSISRESVNFGSIEGALPKQILKMRFHIYLVLYVKLCALEVPDLPKIYDNPISLKETITKLYEEIRVIMQTFSTVNCQVTDDSFGEYLESLHEHLLSYKEKEEFIFTSATTGSSPPAITGHCMYVALSKLDRNNVLVRIDNRWLSGNFDSVIHGKLPYKEGNSIKPCCMGTFNLEHDKETLFSYIKDILRLLPNAQKCSYVYGKDLPKKIAIPYTQLPPEVKEYIETWPYHRIQGATSNNCTLSSYNLGISVRQGMEFFEWLRGKEEQLAPPLSSTNVENIITSQHCNDLLLLAGNSAIPEKINYSHIELMKKFQRELNVEYSEVFMSIAVEQSLVGLAGIHTGQEGASFRQNSSDNTIFHLNFKDLIEKQSFLKYYSENYPGLIIEVLDNNMSGKISIIMNTRKLYEEVAPALGRYGATTITESISEDGKDARWL
jgi:ankyrin repeat protein/Trp operon repressor